MGKLGNLKYLVWYPKYKATGQSGGKTISALADSLSIGINGLFKFSQDFKLKQRLDQMYPDIHNAMKDNTGVLVVVLYQQWHNADPEFNPPELLSVIIGPAANNQQSAFRRWQNRPKILQGPEDNKVPGPTAYLWFTRELSPEERQDRIEAEREDKFWKPAP